MKKPVRNVLIAKKRMDGFCEFRKSSRFHPNVPAIFCLLCFSIKNSLYSLCCVCKVLLLLVIANYCQLTCYNEE